MDETKTETPSKYAPEIGKSPCPHLFTITLQSDIGISVCFVLQPQRRHSHSNRLLLFWPSNSEIEAFSHFSHGRRLINSIHLVQANHKTGQNWSDRHKSDGLALAIVCIPLTICNVPTELSNYWMSMSADCRATTPTTTTTTATTTPKRERRKTITNKIMRDGAQCHKLVDWKETNGFWLCCGIEHASSPGRRTSMTFYWFSGWTRLARWIAVKPEPQQWIMDEEAPNSVFFCNNNANTVLSSLLSSSAPSSSSSC